ncbi:hypothetical protein ABJV28_004727, partial [Escherichia coli]
IFSDEVNNQLIKNDINDLLRGVFRQAHRQESVIVPGLIDRALAIGVLA